MNLSSIPWTALVVFVSLFLLVTGLGVLASRWKAGNLNLLSEWSLGGQKFGILTTWFLVGGDFYTAYTVIAVPALVYAVGGYGFFALPYTIIVYPFVFLAMPILWSECRRRGCLNVADFVRSRHGSPMLMLAIAATGILATLPYIALQLEGMQVVIAAVGLGRGAVSLVAAFLLLAIFTYHSGIRAPAMIAFVKDIMIYAVVIAAVIWIPSKLGGYAAVFAAAGDAFETKGGAASLVLLPDRMLPYATLALGSALAAFMYPHTLTGILSSSGPEAIRWNAILLPAYTVLLGLIALLGYMALAAGIHTTVSAEVVPLLFQKMFPEWFVGFSFVAIAIAALVPASIMAIGSSSLFVRNIWKPFVRPGLTERDEGSIAKMSAMIVLLGALVVVLFLPTQYAIDLQLLGGVCILQTFPAIVGGLTPFRFRSGTLLAGWAVGMVAMIALAFCSDLKPIVTISVGGEKFSCYIGLLALGANMIVVLAGLARESISIPRIESLNAE